VKKIIILPVGSHRSFRRGIRWGLFLLKMAARLPESTRHKDPAHGKEAKKNQKEIAKPEIVASLFLRESISKIEESPLTGNP
jgi:hypothetical protein